MFQTLTLSARAQFPQVWWVDPAGAILISAYIIFSWAMILRNQARLVSAAACGQAPLLIAACARLPVPVPSGLGASGSCAELLAGAWGQVDKIVGASAPEDTLESLEALASAHHAQVRQRACCAGTSTCLSCSSAASQVSLACPQALPGFSMHS